jgi:hypothetical protein
MKTKDRGEKRTYTVIPATVQVMDKSIRQPLGRQAQQGQHVMGRYMWIQGFHAGPLGKWVPTTGITLACRDSKELGHVLYLLTRANIEYEIFMDDNAEAYGPGIRLITAICTEPVYKDQVTGILDYLPLWPGEQG